MKSTATRRLKLAIQLTVLWLTLESANCQLEMTFDDDIFRTLADAWNHGGKFRHDEDETHFVGTIGGGNYTYYTYDGKEPIRVKLVTTKGDADLYIGQQQLKPTFENEKHDLQSTTCGLDIVEVPSYMKRPVGIGVYGHPSNEVSKYVLYVELLPEEIHKEDSNGYFDFEEDLKAKEDYVTGKKSHRDTGDDSDDLPPFLTFLLKVLSIILEIIL
ncbi:Uncharacterized protein HDE_01534 [Halotydeus destructor]|nr:Uncharacterized protein HDE_01534 [Halotydeus destructor]